MVGKWQGGGDLREKMGVICHVQWCVQWLIFTSKTFLTIFILFLLSSLILSSSSKDPPKRNFDGTSSSFSSNPSVEEGDGMVSLLLPSSSSWLVAKWEESSREEPLSASEYAGAERDGGKASCSSLNKL